MVRSEPLPLDREHPVALHVAECPVVTEHVEPVERSLERTTGLVTTVLALAHVGTNQRHTLVDAELANPIEQLMLGQRRMRVADRRQQLVLGLGVEVDQFDLGGRLDRRRAEQIADQCRRVVSCGREIVAPASTTVGQVDTAQESSGSPCAARATSGRRTRGTPAANSHASAAAAPRTPARCRRSRRSTSQRPAGSHAPRRVPWPWSPCDTRTRCRRGPARRWIERAR